MDGCPFLTAMGFEGLKLSKIGALGVPNSLAPLHSSFFLSFFLAIAGVNE